MDQTVKSGRLLLLREEGGGNADHIHCCEERHNNQETMKVRVSEHPGHSLTERDRVRLFSRGKGILYPKPSIGQRKWILCGWTAKSGKQRRGGRARREGL